MKGRAIKLACLLAALLFLAPAPRAALAERYITQYTHGDRELPRIAVTLDDWYEPELLKDFLDAAKEYGCRLTLYPVGIALKAADRALWQRVIDEGHELGNHSNTHRRMSELTRDSILKQLGNMEKNLWAALGHEHTLNTVRYPYGDGRLKGLSGPFAAAVRDAGYVHAVLWDVDDGTAKEMLKKTQNGSILLLHGNRRSLRTLRQILPELAARGYEMVTVSELLHLTKTGRSDTVAGTQADAPASPSGSPAQPETATTPVPVIKEPEVEVSLFP